jgi:hypothetical protein
MIYSDFRLVSPDVVEQVHHDPDSLVPYQFVISLLIASDIGDERCPVHTSENAGAAIFRYFFHSSPSEATMFDPKIDNTAYRYSGFGNAAREAATSYRPWLKARD